MAKLEAKVGDMMPVVEALELMRGRKWRHERVYWAEQALLRLNVAYLAAKPAKEDGNGGH